MSEMSDERKKEILREIIELTAIPEPRRPPDSITAKELADEMGVGLSRARAILRQGVIDGKLKLEKVRGLGYWSPVRPTD